jgi:hypothetical protein
MSDKLYFVKCNVNPVYLHTQFIVRTQMKWPIICILYSAQSCVTELCIGRVGRDNLNIAINKFITYNTLICTFSMVVVRYNFNPKYFDLEAVTMTT